MRIIGFGLLDEFYEKNTLCQKWITNWIADVRFSRWGSSQDVKSKFPSCSILEENIIVFPMGISGYCIKTQIAFKLGVVAVTWTGKQLEDFGQVNG